MQKLPRHTNGLVLDVKMVLDELMQYEAEPAVLANALARVSYMLIELRRQLALDLRSYGYSWAEVGAVFGMTKQGARAAWSGTVVTELDPTPLDEDQGELFSHQTP